MLRDIDSRICIQFTTNPNSVQVYPLPEQKQRAEQLLLRPLLTFERKNTIIYDGSQIPDLGV